ncbi:5'-3' exonuclease [Microbacterium sp. EYE_5]|uniref:5'-3' exonuclease n=1 Tax=unclassified Microbacterium TaxID=2609290 RepID=UPI00200590F8|nr:MULTISPECIES: 5'-3' exonuclease [unclassified Microbacterium]MCK6080478.1 5'-3' exonuclease [Microbacterium sp. EYE_382]MCK6085749.1 5'-3' exonuclease [Microbacterium sp. EYE_384]MCK6124753.1 5'-3' exonuclease [Microbacterium sp. EYE_80]MCK6127662.1 5'-3' exonuclease [Microbacterium sp. EYE_79]MCK6141433.1 5'-3' exonuclease [Microbacterium sp. EYE_39]
MTDRLMLLDTASLYFRAYYGVPDTVKAPDGRPVNAARGLLDMIAKLVTTYEPTHVVACWDDDWRPQWRVDLIPSYKAHRVAEVVPGSPDVEEVPDPLEVQIPVIREALGVLGIPIVGAAEHEADDVIGTLATRSTIPVDVVTGDRDLFQLVDDARDVRVVYTGRGMSNLEVLTDAIVQQKYGISPRQYADFAVMRGDASDGLPGVAGVGEKTATTLLTAHGDLSGIRAAAAAGEGMSAGVRAKILAADGYLDVAPTVVEVVRTIPLPDIDARIRPIDEDAARALSDTWSLGTAVHRAVTALTARA